jgi:hypothetical protein
MNESTHYEYADGSANVYVITATTLEYIPVKPEESSTGFYSGGTPETVSITHEQFDDIVTLLQKAIDNETIHIADRMKMSGLILVISGKQVKQHIITPQCKEQLDIEALLKSHLKLQPKR